MLKNQRKVPDRPSPNDVTEKDRPEDYTGPSAPNRALFINLYFLKFGSDDKIQGAAIFVCICLTILIILVLMINTIKESSALTTAVLDWIKSPFLLALGAAVGRAGTGNGKSQN